MPKEVMNIIENINSAQPVRNEELQHAPNRPSFVFISFGERCREFLDFFILHVFINMFPTAPHSVPYGLPNVGTNIGSQILRLLCFYVWSEYFNIGS
jgi:hypothetical protein